MTTKEKFAKALILAQTIINFGKQAPAAVVEEVKFEAFKIKDSDALVEYSSLEVGAEIKSSSPSGSVPAADGSYSLENGVSVVAKDGKIESFEKPAEEPTQEQKDAANAKTAEEKMSAVYEERYTALETEFNALKVAFDAAIAKIEAAPTKSEIESFNAVAVEFKQHAEVIGESIVLLSKIPTEFSKREVEAVPADEKEAVNESYQKIADYWSAQQAS